MGEIVGELRCLSLLQLGKRQNKMDNKNITYKMVLLWISCFLFLIPSASMSRTLEVVFSFDVPEELGSQLAGYSLLIGAEPLCTKTISEITVNEDSTYSLSCDIQIEDGTYDFQLSAFYSDGGQSDPSPNFTYNVGVGSLPSEFPSETTLGAPDGNKLITYTWDKSSNDKIAGYSMFLNDERLCQSTSALSTSLTCRANLIRDIMTFSVAPFDVDGHEGDRSNILVFNPLEFPELFLTKLLTFEFSNPGDLQSDGGFRVYNNGELICESSDGSVNQISCQSQLESGDNVFTIKAVSVDGTESLASNPIVYNSSVTASSGSSSSDPEQPSIITANFNVFLSTTNGAARATFDASNSKGTGLEYEWDFGDNQLGLGEIVTHEYVDSGTYTVKLSLSDENGQKATSETIITIGIGSMDDSGPSAVVSSQPTAVGTAPLTLTFDGSGSTSPTSSLTHFWSFGDGSKEVTGEIVEHTYESEGSYEAKLTVIDANNISSSTSTPVLVKAQPVAQNELPIAVINPSITAGDCPLVVSFNGSGSRDNDGFVEEYIWMFEGGINKSGENVTHEFVEPGTYQVQLLVKDNLQGASETVAQDITCNATPEVAFPIQIGELTINHEWVAVSLETPFKDPVIIVGPPSANDQYPTLVQIRNVSSDGFEIRLREWKYQNGTHGFEQVSYMVVEQGVHTLQYGKQVEAGYFSATSDNDFIEFQQQFSTVPIVLTTVSSHNDEVPVVGRINNVSSDSFEYRLQEEQRQDNKHFEEKIAYLAWETGSGVDSGLRYEVSRSKDNVTNYWRTVLFNNEFSTLPFFLADMQTMDGGDTAAIRYKKLRSDGVKVRVQEEQSKDKEVSHTSEVVGYIVVGADG